MRLAGVSRLWTGGGEQRRLIETIVVRQTHVLMIMDPGVQCSGHVARVEPGSDGDAGEVDWSQPMREQRPLHTNHVPAEDLVTAGHGEQPLPGHDPVPGLEDRTLWQRNSSHATLYLTPQLTSVTLSHSTSVPGQYVGTSGGVIMQREDSKHYYYALAVIFKIRTNLASPHGAVEMNK